MTIIKTELALLGTDMWTEPLAKNGFHFLKRHHRQTDKTGSGERQLRRFTRAQERRQRHGAVLNRRLLQHRAQTDRKSTRLNSSHSQISYAVFCLKKKKLPWTKVRVFLVPESMISVRMSTSSCQVRSDVRSPHLRNALTSLAVAMCFLAGASTRSF